MVPIKYLCREYTIRRYAKQKFVFGRNNVLPRKAQVVPIKLTNRLA